MTNLKQDIELISNIKNDLAQAITFKGQPIDKSDPFDMYAPAITNISGSSTSIAVNQYNSANDMANVSNIGDIGVMFEARDTNYIEPLQRRDSYVLNNVYLHQNVTLPHEISLNYSIGGLVANNVTNFTIKSNFAQITCTVKATNKLNAYYDSTDGIHYTFNADRSTTNILNTFPTLAAKYNSYSNIVEAIPYFIYKKDLHDLTGIKTNTGDEIGFLNINLNTENSLKEYVFDNNGLHPVNFYNNKITNIGDIINYINNLQPYYNKTSSCSNVNDLYNNYAGEYMPFCKNYNLVYPTDAAYMFYNCNNLTSVPNFNTSNVTDMASMFRCCDNLTSVPNYDTSNVTNMYYMFGYCNNLTSVPNFNTSNVTDMKYMFLRLL